MPQSTDIKTVSAKLKQNLADNVNGNAVIQAYCAAITNTTVAPATGDWYQPFMTSLAKAQGHASLYLNTIGPQAWSVVPNAIVSYGQTTTNSLPYIKSIVEPAKKSGTPLTAGQIETVLEILGNLNTTLAGLLGTPKDTNLSVDGGAPPAQPTIYGCLNDLIAFDTTITQDNRDLITGQDGAAKEVGLLKADVGKLVSDIGYLQGELQSDRNAVMYSEMGIGVSLFVAVAGLALAIPTAGVSLVATGVGVAGLAASVSTTIVYSLKAKHIADDIVDDQTEMTTDQQQVAQLNAIIMVIDYLKDKNKLAQAALQATVDQYTSISQVTSDLISDITKAKAEDDLKTATNFAISIDIDDAVDEWSDLVNGANGILGMNVVQTKLTPPPPTGSKAA